MNWFKRPNKEKANMTAALPAKVLLISDYLSESLVCFLPAGLTKEVIFSKLVSILPISDPGLALEAILQREKAGSVMLTETIAIPHARLKGLKSIQLAVGIVQEDGGSIKDRKVFFLFFSPSEDTKTHLLFLSSLSSLLQTEGVVDALLNSKVPSEVIQTLREVERGA